MRLLGKFIGLIVVIGVRFITAGRGIWQDCRPYALRRIYYANHGSMLDFVLIWALLPPRVRHKVRPVAGQDYWLAGPIRRFTAYHVFNVVLIDRKSVNGAKKAIDDMAKAIDKGYSLILFPEGTRNMTNEKLLPFKAGLFYLAKLRSDLELVPTWIDNLNRVLPKGAKIPIPLMCSVTFGRPFILEEKEAKSTFLDRAEHSLLDLS